MHRLACLLHSPALMLKNGFLSTTIGALILLAAGLRADTVILKSGEKIEGKVLSDTDTELTVSVQITPTIKDDRVIKKTEVDRVEKVMPDEQAWAPLAAVAPGRDSLERENYDQVITALGYFLGTFPKSAHAKVAQERLEQFQVEQKRIERGDVKMDGQWLDKEKVQEERAQIGGHILFNRMKAHASAGRSIEAMLVFDQLEKNFGGSASYPDAVSFTRKILAALRPVVEQQQARLKHKAEDDKQRLKTAIGAEKVQLEALLKREQTANEAAVSAVEKSGAKWLPLQPATERSMASLMTRITSETTRLNGLPVEKMVQSVKTAETAAAELAKNDIASAEKDLAEASSAWPKNELAERLRKKLADMKKTEAAAKTEAGKPKAAPTPKPKATPAPQSAEVTEEVKTPEAVAFYKKPFFFITLVALAAFGSIAAKVFGKIRATQR